MEIEFVNIPPLVGLPAPFTSRVAGVADAALLNELWNACEIAEQGSPEWEETAVHSVLAQAEPGLVRLILDRDGVVAGSVSVDDRGAVVFNAELFIRPDAQGTGIDVPMLDWAERVAAARASTEHPRSEVLLRSFGPANSERFAALHRDHGFREVRRFWKMRRALDETLPPVAWPVGITLVPASSPEDDLPIRQLVREAFSAHWMSGPLQADERWIRSVLHEECADTSLWVAAWDGAERAGILLARAGDQRGYVAYVAVREQWRGRGLGRALLLEGFRRLQERGETIVELGVDAGNGTGAVRLYESVGMTQVACWAAWEKQVRPGTPWLEAVGRDPVS